MNVFSRQIERHAEEIQYCFPPQMLSPSFFVSRGGPFVSLSCPPRGVWVLSGLSGKVAINPGPIRVRGEATGAFLLSVSNSTNTPEPDAVVYP